MSRRLAALHTPTSFLVAGLAAVLVSCATKPAPTLGPTRSFSRVVIPAAPTVLWDASPSHSKLANYRLVATGPSSTNWNTGLALTFAPPLSPGTWQLHILAVGTNGVVSDPSNVLTLTWPFPEVFSFDLQFSQGTGWTNYQSMLATNPPQGMFRVEMRKVP